MFKALIKRLFIALFNEEIEALTIDLQARIERLQEDVSHDLLNDLSFPYEVSQEIIRDGDLCDEVEDRLRETLEMLEGRIDDIESQLEELV